MAAQSAGSSPGQPDPQAKEPAVSRAAGAQPDASAQQPVCDLCGAFMQELHCKLVCPRCGYQRDCSDP